MESADWFSLGHMFHFTDNFSKESKGEAVPPKRHHPKKVVLAMAFFFYSDALLSGTLLTLEGLPLPG